ncbi:hypothetical protein BLNAU_6890 [Blattamonas nauphoetae]|uniref:Protein kinase domain-containing protein n=1 Tax=Blattamonas nauphoetae TaxID=2049346 RepID=A0ABQ9Y372_9EUKA|nr:hypothetical protein BLNAU_6890 [Blattamonas nauphoetae]
MSNSALLPQISSYSPNGGTLSIITSTVSSLISSTRNQLLPHPNLTTTIIANSVISNITFQDIPYSPELSSFSSNLLIHSFDVSDSDRLLYCGFVDLNQPNVGHVSNASLIRTSANADYTNTQYGHQDISSYQTISNTKASGLTSGCFFIKNGNQLTLQTCLFQNIKRSTSGTVVHGDFDNTNQAVIMKKVICDTCNSTGGQGTIWTHLGRIEIEDSEFRSCEAEDYGGAIRIGFNINPNPLLITNTLFSKCGVRSGPGGAISGKINGRDKTRIVGCIFENCYCPRKGAALDLWDGKQFYIADCLFIDNKAGGSNTSDLQIWDTTKYEFDLDNGLIGCLSSSQQPRISFVNTSLTEEETAKYFPIFTLNVLILAESGNDAVFCGYDYKPRGDCRTINYAVQNLKSFKSDPFYYISIRSADDNSIYPINTSITNQFTNMEVRHYAADTLGRISCESPLTYLSSTASGFHHRFRDLHIHHFTNTDSNVQAMFKVEGGSLSVIHCSLDGCETDTNQNQIKTPLFKISSGSVTCSELSVTSLTFIGAKLIETTSYASLSVTDSKFASLTSDSTLINLKGSSGTTTFTSTIFTDVSASTQPMIDVDITGTVLFDRTTFENASPLTSTLYTASSSSKVQFSGASLLSVAADTGIIETKTGTVQMDACLIGPSTPTTITSALLTAGYADSTTTATLNIASSTFKNIKSNGAPALSVAQKGVVSMTSCVVESSSTMVSSLFSVTSGGQLTIDTLFFASISSSSGPIIQAGSGSTLILSGRFSSTTDAQMSATTVDLGASSLISSSSTLTMNAITISNLQSTSPLIVLTPTNEKTTIGKSETTTHFESIKSSSTAGGSAISSTLTSGAALSISSTDFLDCSSTNGNGGAVSVSIVDGTLTIASTVSFKKCSSSGNGGALFIDLTGRKTGSFSLNNIVYGSGEDTNSCAESRKGTDLFIAVKKGDLEVINSTSVIGTYFTTPESEAATFSLAELSKYEFSESDGVSGSILYLFNGYSGGELVVDSSKGFEHSLCGHSKLPCDSLHTGFALLKGENAAVVMQSGSDVSAGIESKAQATIKSNISTKQTVKLVSDVSITVSQDCLTVNTLIFTAPDVPLSSSFFVVSGGSFSVSNCEFTSISSTDGGSAISATLDSSAALSISLATFVGCSSTEGDGGAVHVTLTGGSFAILSSSSFKSCSSSGVGGAIFVDASSDSELSFNIANAVFGVLEDDGNKCGEDKSGNDVFIKAGDLSSFKKKELFPSKYSVVTIDNTLVDSIRLSSSHTAQVLSLLQYLYTPLTSGLVSDLDTVSSDVAQCGFLELHCKSLNRLIENAKAISLATINASLTIRETFAPTSTFVITSISESRSSLVLSALPSLSVNSDNIQLTLTQLSISSKSSTSNSETDLVVVQNGILIVSDSSFTTQTTLSSAFVSISKGGSLQITGLDVTSAQLTDNPLFKTEGSGSVNIQSSSFASIARDDFGNGTVLSSHLASSSSFVLDNIDITNCGTAILLDMNDCTASTQYSVTNLKFFSIGSEPQLVVVGEDLYSFITSEHWTGSYEYLTENKDVLNSFDAKWDLKVSLLTYLIPYEGDVILNKGNGGQSPICGSGEVPCSSLEIGLTRVANSGNCVCRELVSLGSHDLTISKSVSIRGDKLSSLLLIENGQTLVVDHTQATESSPILFSSLTFGLPSQETTKDGFIIVQNGFVKLDLCVLQTSSLASPAIVSRGGEAVLSRLTFDVGSFQSPVFALDENTTVDRTSIENVVFVLLKAVNSNFLHLSSVNLTNIGLEGASNTDDVCSWEGGVIELVSSITTVSSSSFSSISTNVFSIVGGSISIEQCVFSKNLVGNEAHPSFQHNFQCADAFISIDETSEFEQSRSSDALSLWISASTCNITAPSSLSPDAPLFVPNLPKKLDVQSYTDSTTPSKNQARKITVKGSNFINCGLVLVIAAKSSSAAAELSLTLTDDLPTGIKSLSSNDSSISFVVDPSTAKLKDGDYLLNILVNTKLMSSFDLFSVTVSKQAKAAQQQQRMILIAACSAGSVLLLLLIVVICCCVRRNKKMKEKEKTEMGEERTLLTDQSEYFQNTVQQSQDNSENKLDIVNNTKRRAQWIVPDSLPLLLFAQRRKVLEGVGLDNKVCVVCQEPDHPLAFGNQKLSLHSRIHSDASPFAEGDADGIGLTEAEQEMYGQAMKLRSLGRDESISIILKVARALLYLKKKGEHSSLLSKETQQKFPPFCISGLTSHSILLYPNGHVLVALPSAFVTSIADTLPIDASTPVSNVVLAEDPDSPRWYSPENENAREFTSDESDKSVVFSLGMILFEMLTEEIPFKETDAINAHRQIKSGSLPNLTLASPPTLSDHQETLQTGAPNDVTTILERALLCDASERLSLSELVHALESVSI